MKVHIYYPITLGPWGGANQFLKALQLRLIKMDVYSDDIKNADVILFNLNPSGKYVPLITGLISIKKKHPDKLLIGRIDGPVLLARGKDHFWDKLFSQFSQALVDGMIFQSEWSRESCYQYGIKRVAFEKTIINAPDRNIFNNHDKEVFSKERKVRLIGSSWSGNPRKGFDVFEWLDENLDTSLFEMTFVGNSPVKFNNIRHVKPLQSDELAAEYKRHDIYIFPSRVEACSNSLVEAMHCGLPVIAYRGSSNPEIVSNGGELFEDPSEIPMLVQKITQNYKDYQNSISLPDIMEITYQYLELAEELLSRKKKHSYKPKQVSIFNQVTIYMSIIAFMKMIGIKELIKSHIRYKGFFDD